VADDPLPALRASDAGRERTADRLRHAIDVVEPTVFSLMGGTDIHRRRRLSRRELRRARR
jgi:hypothetical protein